VIAGDLVVAAMGPLCAFEFRQDVGEMPDKKGLRLVGLAYGCAVAIIAMIALVVVTGHINTAVEARPDPVMLSAR
jgi:hypothetical protein